MSKASDFSKTFLQVKDEKPEFFISGCCADVKACDDGPRLGISTDRNSMGNIALLKPKDALDLAAWIIDTFREEAT